MCPESDIRALRPGARVFRFAKRLSLQGAFRPDDFTLPRDHCPDRPYLSVWDAETREPNEVRDQIGGSSWEGYVVLEADVIRVLTATHPMMHDVRSDVLYDCAWQDCERTDDPRGGGHCGITELAGEPRKGRSELRAALAIYANGLAILPL